MKPKSSNFKNARPLLTRSAALASMICLILLFNSCKKDFLQPDSPGINNITSGSTYLNENISFTQLQANLAFSKNKVLRDVLAISKKGKAGLLIQSSEDSVPMNISVETVKKIKTIGHTSYTLALIPEAHKSSTFRNLTIDSSAKGIKAFITKYIPDNKWHNAYKVNKNVQFSGKVIIQPIELKNITSNVTLSRNDDRVSTEVCEIYDVVLTLDAVNCNGTEHHRPGETCPITIAEDRAHWNLTFEPLTFCFDDLSPITVTPVTIADFGNSPTYSPPANTGDETITPHGSPTGPLYPPNYVPCNNDHQTGMEGDPNYDPNAGCDVVYPYSATVSDIMYELEIGDETLINPIAINSSYAAEMWDLMDEHEFDSEVKLTSVYLLDLMRNDQFENFDAQSIQTLGNHISMTQQQADELLRIWITLYVVNAAKHPEWSDTKLKFETTLEMVHYGLDALGLILGFGEIADIVNGGIYLMQGQNTNAVLSFGSAIPIAGWFSTGAKYAVKVVELSPTIKRSLTWVKLANGKIGFGSPSKLRAMLKLGKYSENALQAHHIVPVELRNHEVIQAAAKAKNPFHLNDALNGIPVTKSQQNGSHPLYTAEVLRKLDDILGNNTTIDIELANAEVTKLIGRIKLWIHDHPGVSINTMTLP